MIYCLKDYIIQKLTKDSVWNAGRHSGHIQFDPFGVNAA